MIKRGREERETVGEDKEKWNGGGKTAICGGVGEAFYITCWHSGQTAAVK